MKKTLRELLKGVNIEEVSGSLDVFITGITEDSREVKPGYLFVARKGTKKSGEEFIKDAVKQGAIAVIKEPPFAPERGITQIIVRDIKEEMGKLALNFFDNPQEKLRLIGITGTNGKTSAAFFVRQALENLGLKTGYIGTVEYYVGEKLPAKETTPSIIKLAELFSLLVKRGFEACVLEVSSHALHQKRLSTLKFEVAGFTNLSRDHLDYHKDMETYYQSKKLLFTEHLIENGAAVISLDTAWGKRLFEELSKEHPYLKLFPVNGEGFEVEVLERGEGIKLKVKRDGRNYEVFLEAIGDFQKFNLGVAWGVLLCLGIEESLLTDAFSGAVSPPGRLEVVGSFKGALLVVDYAHTPSALKSALLGLKPWVRNRLILVFGCGGNRDKGKRQVMGEIAEELADIVIVTSDNPRFEDPQAIIKDILKGFKKKKPLVIPDRREAIEKGVEILEEGDVLLVAGKGHEEYQEIGGKKIPFSDREELLRVVKEAKAQED